VHNRADRANQVTRLDLVKAGRRRSLIPEGVGIRLSDENSFAWYWNAAVWKGPRSRMELIFLFHELGHGRSFGHRNAAEKQLYNEHYSKCAAPGLNAVSQAFIVGEERFAWAHALRTMRQLKREGFDLFANIPRQEILKEIYSQQALGSYYLKGSADRVNPLIRAFAEQGTHP